MRKRIKSSINKGESLSTKDITDIHELRKQDKEQLKKLRDDLISSKDIVNQQKTQIDTLLGTIKLEKRHCTDATYELRRKFTQENEELRNKQLLLQNKYDSKINDLSKQFKEQSLLTKTNNNNQKELAKIVKDNHKSKITELNKFCQFEQNRLTLELNNNDIRFKLLNSKLKDKNAQIEQDAKELSEQKILASKQLIDIKVYEQELKVKINDFNSSKKEYNKLIKQLHIDKKKLKNGMDTVSDIISRKKYINKMEKTVSEQMESIQEKENKLDKESASHMDELSRHIDMIDKGKLSIKKGILEQTKVLDKKKQTINERSILDSKSISSIVPSVLSHPKLSDYKRPTELSPNEIYKYGDLVSNVTTEPKRKHVVSAKKKRWYF
jgi:hypothetical protein